MNEVLENTGAGDGARTRDLRRDRPDKAPQFQGPFQLLFPKCRPNYGFGWKVNLRWANFQRT